MKLLFSILCPKPEQRATITEIETNPWVTQPVDISLYKWEDVIRNTEFHGNNAGDCNLDEDLLIKPFPRLKNLANDEKTTQEASSSSSSSSKTNNLNHDQNDLQLNQQNAINLLMSKSF